MLGKIDWRTQTELLKNQNKVHSILVQMAKGRIKQRAGKQGLSCHIDLVQLSRQLNCVNITGEISSHLMKEKEVTPFL